MIEVGEECGMMRMRECRRMIEVGEGMYNVG